MKKIGRNDPCPCGSGKKFKKCHMGREDDLSVEGIGEISLEEMAARIISLPLVHYGRSREIVDGLDIPALTGQPVGIKFVDLKDYNDLNIFGSIHPKALKGRSGGVFINLYKTAKADPEHIYLAISRNIDESTLAHEIAHVLDYLGGSKLVPGTLEALSLELGVPVDHLEHPDEYGYWLDYLSRTFDIQLDADDAIIAHLYEKGRLIKGKEIQANNGLIIRSKSDGMLKYLSAHSEEVDALIRDLPGYIRQDRKKD
ncbi:MAG: SEC-C domain-containing protein [Deltaproteobacteria bacterium]|nr:SEC-C domain-containing protein [Deltaproteobacteria bacterium]MBW1945423.1 SEC-C domain-containing protein [Deltaproteobacteria bacterium]MBW2206861.1 SEC-C domain-containing protein [Deltaproteobacteria bacterium]